MASVTYDIATPTAETPTRRRGFFIRVLKAIEDSRMRHAEREINRHRHLMPDGLEQAANRLNSRTERGLPFIR